MQGDSSSVSGPAQLLAKLQDLEKSDPAKAKEMLTKIADKLKSAASTASGGAATKLSDLAEKFQKAADTGDLSGLQPPAPPSGAPPSSGHRHYHHAKAQQSSDDTLETLQSVVSSELSAA